MLTRDKLKPCGRLLVTPEVEVPENKNNRKLLWKKSFVAFSGRGEKVSGRLSTLGTSLRFIPHPIWRMTSRMRILHHSVQFSLLFACFPITSSLSRSTKTVTRLLPAMASPFKRMKHSSIGSEESTEPIFFFSGSRYPYCQFSNFYEVDIEMEEGVFPSVEHYFQGMKFISKDRKRFMKGEEFDRKKETKATNAKEEMAKGRLAKSAGSKSGSAKYNLTLASDGLDQEVAKRRMKRALEKKFEKEPFKSLLLETGATRQLIHIPMRGKTDFWTGKRDKNTGEIVGENTMGKLLMEVRHALLRKDHDDSSGKDCSNDAD